MKVPTYKAQTALTSEVGARPMRVRATAEAFGAAEARALGGLAQTIGSAAVSLNEKQRRAAEEEQRIAKGLKTDKALNEFLKESSLIAEEAKKQPVEKQEDYYDDQITILKERLENGFAKGPDRLDIGNRFERIALGKRIDVRGSANTLRIEARIAEKAEQEGIYIDSAINAEGAAFEAEIANLETMYQEMVRDRLMTAPDAAKRQEQVKDKILYEREVNIANSINDPEKARQFVERIEADERFDPTVRRRLASMVSGVLAGKESTLKAHKSEFSDNIASLDSVIKAGVPIPDGDIERIMQAGTMLDQATGDVKYSRDAQQIFEANENTKIFAQNASIDAIDAIIEQAEDAARGSFVNIEERGYAADRLIQARAFKAEMVTAYENGKGLDFLQKRNPDEVKQFDFADFSGSLARRQVDMSNVNGKVGYDPFTNKPLYQQNFFTEEEAIRVGQLISNADPEALASFAVAFQKVGMKHPQVWEQIASTGLDGQMFSLAGAIEKPTVAEHIFRGALIMKEDANMKPKTSDYVYEYEQVVGDVYLRPGTSGETNAAVKNAVVAHYVGSGGSREEFDDSLFQASIDAVTGGIGEINGFKVELPPEIDEDLFQTLIDEMTPEMLRENFAPDGFEHLNLTDEQAIAIIQNNRIVSVKSGIYGVVDPITGLPVLSTVMQNGRTEGLRMQIRPDLQAYLTSKGVQMVISTDMLYSPFSGRQFVQ